LTPLDIETIELRVEIEKNVVTKVTSSGNRLRGYERAFVGKDPIELLRIIPRVLSTCSQSHVLAYAEAVAEPGNWEEASRIMAILEIVESHMKHPYAYWFPYLGGEEYSFPSGIKFRRISEATRKVRTLMEKVGGKWPSVGHLSPGAGVRFRLQDLIDVIKVFQEQTIGMDLDSFLELSDLEELRGDSALLNKVEPWRAGLKRYLVIGFPFRGDFSPHLITDEGNTVTYSGQTVEVGPLAQALSVDPLIRKLHHMWGPSPLLRELSRLRIVAFLLRELRDVDLVSEGVKIRGGGVGGVESIRGSLIHIVDLGEKVRDYRIVQPTTFNASPGGALEKAVQGIPINDPRSPWEISLAVSSLDSCFVTQVEVFNEGKFVLSKRIGGFC